MRITLDMVVEQLAKEIKDYFREAEPADRLRRQGESWASRLSALAQLLRLSSIEVIQMKCPDCSSETNCYTEGEKGYVSGSTGRVPSLVWVEGKDGTFPRVWCNKPKGIYDVARVPVHGVSRGEASEPSAGTNAEKANDSLSAILNEVQKMAARLDSRNVQYELDMCQDAIEEARRALGDEDAPFIDDAIRKIKYERDQLKKENKCYRERLQFDPGGSDKIDELEQAMQFLRHDRDCLVVERDTLQDKISRLQVELNKPPLTQCEIAAPREKTVHELECQLIPFNHWDDDKSWQNVVPKRIQKQMYAEPPTASWGLGHDDTIGWYVMATQGQGGGVVWQEKE